MSSTAPTRRSAQKSSPVSKTAGKSQPRKKKVKRVRK
jgi:hypothetical protein